MGADLQRRAPRTEPDDEQAAGAMGLLEHLEELRKRIIRACLAIGCGMAVAGLFVYRIGDFVLAPTYRLLPPGSQLVFISPGEAFSFYLNIALIGGAVLAAPFVMYQVWGFIAPGLYAKEKKFVVPFVLLTTLGSLCGALFSHYLLFPSMMTFFSSFSSPRMRFMPRVEDTVDLYMKMLLGMVIVFQIPTLVFSLAKMRVVTARFLWRNIKYAILVIFILAAVLTPSTDPWNQTVFAAPMIALYLIGIAIAWVVAPRGEKERTAHADSGKLRLVFAATMIDQARRHRRPSRAEFPSLRRRE
jgi:sec-independent protein translocase protein TatC